MTLYQFDRERRFGLPFRLLVTPEQDQDFINRHHGALAFSLGQGNPEVNQYSDLCQSSELYHLETLADEAKRFSCAAILEYQGQLIGSVKSYEDRTLLSWFDQTIDGNVFVKGGLYLVSDNVTSAVYGARNFPVISLIAARFVVGREVQERFLPNSVASLDQLLARRSEEILSLRNSISTRS